MYTLRGVGPWCDDKCPPPKRGVMSLSIENNPSKIWDKVTYQLPLTKVGALCTVYDLYICIL